MNLHLGRNSSRVKFYYEAILWRRQSAILGRHHTREMKYWEDVILGRCHTGQTYQEDAMLERRNTKEVPYLVRTTPRKSHSSQEPLVNHCAWEKPHKRANMQRCSHTSGFTGGKPYWRATTLRICHTHEPQHRRDNTSKSHLRETILEIIILGKISREATPGKFDYGKESTNEKS